MSTSDDASCHDKPSDDSVHSTPLGVVWIQAGTIVLEHGCEGACLKLVASKGNVVVQLQEAIRRFQNRLSTRGVLLSDGTVLKSADLIPASPNIVEIVLGRIESLAQGDAIVLSNRNDASLRETLTKTTYSPGLPIPVPEDEMTDDG